MMPKIQLSSIFKIQHISITINRHRDKGREGGRGEGDRGGKGGAPLIDTELLYRIFTVLEVKMSIFLRSVPVPKPIITKNSFLKDVQFHDTWHRGIRHT